MSIYTPPIYPHSTLDKLPTHRHSDTLQPALNLQLLASSFSFLTSTICRLKIPGDGPSLTLNGAHIKSSDVVCLLEKPLTPNLSTDKHVTSFVPSVFFQVGQLRHIRYSLDNDYIATLVHAFIINHIDFCVSLL